MLKNGASEESINRITSLIASQDGKPDIEHRLISVFCELNDHRQTGFNGVQPFSVQDIHLYCECYDEQLTPMEKRIVKQMDLAFIGEFSKQIKER